MSTDKRLSLHAKLIEILGSNNVYFQPPETLKMKYPCIRYTKSRPMVEHADNKRYFNKSHYELIVIDTDPDTAIPDNIAEAFPYCSIDRYYSSNNLTHCALDLYY